MLKIIRRRCVPESETLRLVSVDISFSRTEAEIADAFIFRRHKEPVADFRQYRAFLDNVAVKAERPLRRLFQPCDQTQKRAFSAAGRPQQHDEFVIGYRQVDLLERLRAVRIDHADAGKLNFSHLIRSCFIKLRCRRSFHPRSHCNNDSTGPRETQPRAARFLSLRSASAVGCI